MPDQLNENGLVTKTANELISELETNLKSIYGQDIDVNQNSPDGQLIGILAQLGVDLRELLTAAYNSFDPDQATGVLLDQRVSINGIARQAGSYSITPIDITVDQTVTLNGLDADFNLLNGQGYTVQDDAGNEWILVDSVTLTPGTSSRNFRSRRVGEITTQINTITSQKTIVLGVTQVNNSSAPISIGVNEENDVNLRLRRGRSFALPAQGSVDSIDSSLLNLDGVSEVVVYENVNPVIDDDGIPPHSLWVIVEGGSNTDIANVLARKKNTGSGWKGETIVPVTRENGTITLVAFDRPVAVNLFIRFTIQPVTLSAFDLESIKTYIVDNLSYGIGDPAETSRITTVAIEAINQVNGVSSGVPINVQVSNNGIDYFEYLEVSNKEQQWTLDVARLEIQVAI